MNHRRGRKSLPSSSSPASTIGMVRSAANSCCWSSIRVSRRRNQGTLNPLRSGSVRGVGAIGLRPHGQSGDAGGALGDGLVQVGQSGLLLAVSHHPVRASPITP